MKLTNHTNNNYKPKQLKLPFVVQKNVLIKLKIQINFSIGLFLHPLLYFNCCQKWHPKVHHPKHI